MVQVVVYPIGIPATYAFILSKYRDSINPPDDLVVRSSERHLVAQDVLQSEKLKLREV